MSIDNLIKLDKRIQELIQEAMSVGRTGEDNIANIELELSTSLELRDAELKDIFKVHDIGLKISYCTDRCTGEKCHSYDLIYT